MQNLKRLFPADVGKEYARSTHGGAASDQNWGEGEGISLLTHLF